MDASGLDEEALLASLAAGGDTPKAEVLLPEVVATMVARDDGLPVRVITTDAKLIGVTHAADLPRGQRRAVPSGGVGHPTQPTLELNSPAVRIASTGMEAGLSAWEVARALHHRERGCSTRNQLAVAIAKMMASRSSSVGQNDQCVPCGPGSSDEIYAVVH